MRRWIVGPVLAGLMASCTVATQSSSSPPAATVRPTTPTQVLPMSDLQVLFWDQATQRDRFARMEDYFAGFEVAPAAKARELPRGEPLPESMRRALDEAFVANHAAGVMILQNGRIRYERYADGFGPDRRWTSFSVAKSFTSALLGAAIEDGAIGGLSDPVTRYIPALKGTAYDGVMVGQVASMTSGVQWNEDYSDPNSDVARMLTIPPQPGEPQSITYARTLSRAAPVGAGKWHYNTLETNLLGDIVKAATGQSLAQYAKAKIVDPAGFAGNLFWMTDLTGQNIGGCCLSLRLADYARFGQFVLEGGDGIVPSGWFTQAGSPITRFEQRPGFGYGYQWWSYPDGAYGAQGIFGQSITIDPKKRLVLAIVSNQPRATGGPERADWARLFARLAQSE